MLSGLCEGLAVKWQVQLQRSYRPWISEPCNNSVTRNYRPPLMATENPNAIFLPLVPVEKPNWDCPCSFIHFPEVRALEADHLPIISYWCNSHNCAILVFAQLPSLHRIFFGHLSHAILGIILLWTLSIYPWPRTITEDALSCTVTFSSSTTKPTHTLITPQLPLNTEDYWRLSWVKWMQQQLKSPNPDFCMISPYWAGKFNSIINLYSRRRQLR